MKTLKYSILIFITVITVTSCYKDLGNYEYHTINQLSIQLDSNYSAYYGSSLKIQPSVNASADQQQNLSDTSKYSYEWSTMNAGALYAEQRRVLSRKPVFDEVISITPATYTLYLRVTDKKTGVMWESSAKLSITTQIYEGWLLMNDVNGKSRLDMLSRNGEDYTFIPSVLDSVASGMDMSGSPVGVFYSPQAGVLTTALTQGIYVSTSKGTNRVDQESFKWASDLNIRYQFFANIPSSFVADNVFGISSQEYLHSSTDNNMYYYYRPMNVKYGVPLNIIASESPAPFKTSKYFAASGSYGIIFFDSDHKRFVRAASGQTGASVMPNDSSYFDYNIGMDLKYLQYSPYGNGEVFSVLHDAVSKKYFLARLTLAASIKQTYFAEIEGEDFDKAENFAVDPIYGYLFYNVGGKVYEYDMGLKQSFLMVDKGNSKISLLTYHRFISTKYMSGSDNAPILGDKLIVASYNPSGQEESNGTMELYQVPQVNGQITLSQSFTGLGKIVGLTYRER